MVRIAVVVLSDKGSRGEREDLSGPAATETLKALGDVDFYTVIPDEVDVLEDTLNRLVREGYNLVVTSGGTGVGPRDITPQTTLRVIEHRMHNMETLVLLEGLKKTPKAAISRGVIGYRGQTLIVNLPGSPKAVREGLDALMPVLPHTLEKLMGDESDCAEG